MRRPSSAQQYWCSGGTRLRPAAAGDVISRSAGHVRSTAQPTRRLLAKTAAGTRDLRVSEPAIAGPSCLGRRRIRRRARGPGRAVRRSARRGGGHGRRADGRRPGRGCRRHVPAGQICGPRTAATAHATAGRGRQCRVDRLPDAARARGDLGAPVLCRPRDVLPAGSQRGLRLGGPPLQSGPGPSASPSPGFKSAKAWRSSLPGLRLSSSVPRPLLVWPRARRGRDRRDPPSCGAPRVLGGLTLAAPDRRRVHASRGASPCRPALSWTEANWPPGWRHEATHGRPPLSKQSMTHNSLSALLEPV